jgi:hypothetical protein
MISVGLYLIEYLTATNLLKSGNRCGRDPTVVEYSTTCAFSANHH